MFVTPPHDRWKKVGDGRCARDSWSKQVRGKRGAGWRVLPRGGSRGEKGRRGKGELRDGRKGGERERGMQKGHENLRDQGRGGKGEKKRGKRKFFSGIRVGET